MIIKPTKDITEIAASSQISHEYELNFAELLTEQEWQTQIGELSMFLKSTIHDDRKLDSVPNIMRELSDIAIVDERRLPELAFDSAVMDRLINSSQPRSTESHVVIAAHCMIAYHKSVTEQFPFDFDARFQTAFSALKQKLIMFDQSMLLLLLSDGAHLQMLFPHSPVADVFNEIFWYMVEQSVTSYTNTLAFINGDGIANSDVLPMLVYTRILNPTKFEQLFPIFSVKPETEIERYRRRLSPHVYEILENVALYKLLLAPQLVITQNGLRLNKSSQTNDSSLPNILNY